MKNYFFIIIAFAASCTSIKPNKPIIISIDNSNSNYPKAKINEIKKIDRGSLLVLIQNKRGYQNFTPNIKDNLLTLKNKKYFTDINVAEISSIDLKTINTELRKAKDKKNKYLLIISYYSNNSVSQSKLHTFLKSSTLNLYDLVPVFSTVTDTFVHNYAFTFEASLIDVDSYYIINNYKVTEFFDEGIKGGTNPKDIDIIYNKNVIDLAAKKLVSLL